MDTCYDGENILVEVTQDDIDKALLDTAAGDPLLCALERMTGSAWYIPGPNVAAERFTPHRSFVIRGEALQQRQSFRSSGTMTPFSFEARLRSVRSLSACGSAAALKPGREGIVRP